MWDGFSPADSPSSRILPQKGLLPGRASTSRNLSRCLVETGRAKTLVGDRAYSHREGLVNQTWFGNSRTVWSRLPSLGFGLCRRGPEQPPAH